MIKKNVVYPKVTPCWCGVPSTKSFGGAVYCDVHFEKTAKAYKKQHGTTNDKSLDAELDKLTEEHK